MGEERTQGEVRDQKFLGHFPIDVKRVSFSGFN